MNFSVQREIARDLTITGENSILTGSFEATSVQIGAKFATGAVNLKHLPLLYQNGLGTNDLLVSEVIRRNEMQVWFLSQHLVNVPLVKAD